MVSLVAGLPSFSKHSKPKASGAVTLSPEGEFVLLEPSLSLESGVVVLPEPPPTVVPLPPLELPLSPVSGTVVPPLVLPSGLASVPDELVEPLFTPPQYY